MIADANLAVVADIFEAHTDRLLMPDSCMSHHTVYWATGHRLFRVRDDDELRPIQELVEHIHKALNVGFIQGCIDFVPAHKTDWGELRKIDSNSATQVSVLSPPLSNEILRGSLPG